MATVTTSYALTTLVENSDDRLAAAEEAKRTGQPFQSVGANKTEIVPQDVAAQIADDKGKENTYVNDRLGATYAAHLEGYHEAIKDPEFVHQTNEEKAAAHEAYSAELVRKQIAEDEAVRAKIKEGYDVTVAIQQANLDRAREHEGKSLQYAEVRAEREANSKTVVEVLDETVKVINAEDLADKPLEERAAALSAVTNVPDAMERPAQEALIVKDQIIATEVPYEEHAMQFEQLQKRDHPGVEILDSAGSPKELRESTVEGQIAASNVSSPEAVAVVSGTDDSIQVDEAPTGEPVADPDAADEMPPTPTE